MENKLRFSKILFLCVANSARSQMAEFIAKKIFPAEFEIKSAGSRPGTRVHSLAIETTSSFNPEIATAEPKDISALGKDFLNANCLVIRLCAEEECPIVTEKIEIRDWNLPDPAQPADGDLNLAFVDTLKILIERIQKLKTEMVPS